MTRSALALAGLLGALGCARGGLAEAPGATVVVPPSVAEPEDLEGDPPSAEAGQLAWVRDAQGNAATWLVGATAPRRVEGVLVSDGVDVYRYVATPVPRPTSPCVGAPVETEAGPGSALRIEVVSLTRHQSVSVLEPPEDASANELNHGVELLASVGPLLFLRETTYGYYCGAHGNTTVALVVWDLRTQRVGNPLAPQEEAAVRATLGPRANQAIATDQGDDPAATTATLVGVLPRYGEAGRLSAAALFTGFACYACGGEWGSYTAHVELPLDPLPSGFHGWERPGGALLRWLAQHPDLTLGGWTTPPPAALAKAFPREP